MAPCKKEVHPDVTRETLLSARSQFHRCRQETVITDCLSVCMPSFCFWRAMALPEPSRTSGQTLHLLIYSLPPSNFQEQTRRCRRRSCSNGERRQQNKRAPQCFAHFLSLWSLDRQARCNIAAETADFDIMSSASRSAIVNPEADISVEVFLEAESGKYYFVLTFFSPFPSQSSSTSFHTVKHEDNEDCCICSTAVGSFWQSHQPCWQRLDAL